MFKSIFTKSIYDKRWAILAWSIGIVALMAIAIAYYPSIGNNPEVLASFNRTVPSGLQAVVGRNFSLTGMDGYLQGNMLGLASPMLVLIMAISMGVSLLASEEDKGTLSVILARPVSRWRLYVEKLLALLLMIFIAVVVMWATTQLMVVAIGEHIDFVRGVEAFVNIWLLGAVFGTLTLTSAAIVGRKNLAIAVPATIAAVMYFIYTFSTGFNILKPLRFLCWWFYYNQGSVILNGLNVRDVSILILSTIVLAGLGIWKFQKRDLNG